MTISSSLNAGVMGLSANASKLAVISDNIANSGTYGYKRSEADFHSMVTGGASGSYTAGGVRVTAQKLIGDRGSLIGTSNATDITVRGRGMIPVTDIASIKSGGTLPMMLSTTGSFRTDDDGYLKSETGQVLMGWPALADGTIPTYPRDTAVALEPVQIRVNEFAGEPTTQMTLGVNLPATATEPGAAGTAEVLTVEYYDNLGTSENLEVTFTPTVPSAQPASNTWTMQLRDQASGGTLVGEYTLTFNDTRTSGGTLASVTTISGQPYNPATGEIGVSVSSGPISITVGLLNTSGGMTQLSDTFAPVAVSKDGAPVGNVTGIDIDSTGMVNVLYDTGITRTVYQVPVADVPNPNGLTALDSQTYLVSRDSGEFFLWDAGAGPTGDIVNYAREESTTDVASELTDLITTQRAYSSNAKVIQTVDEMLQETTNIKR